VSPRCWRRHRRRCAVDPRRPIPGEDDFALTVAVKDRRGAHVGGDRRARCRTVASQTEIEGAQEQGLAAPVSPVSTLKPEPNSRRASWITPSPWAYSSNS